MKQPIESIKKTVNLHDLAGRLGLSRPGGKGNYRSPRHKDKNPSVSIYSRNGNEFWKDHSTGTGGDHIDLVVEVLGLETGEAIKWLAQEYSIPLTRQSAPTAPKAPKATHHYIIEKCLSEPERARDYLQSRGLTDKAIDQAIKSKTIGFNDWRSPKRPAGEVGHGGPAAAFIVQDFETGEPVAVDLRYIDPSLNGGVKTQSHGEKNGRPWTSSRARLKSANTVFVVESPINALSIDVCEIPHAAAIATRGVGTIDSINWGFLQGKFVIIAMDNDKPNEQGFRPGKEAGLKLYDALTADLIPCLLLDQSTWDEFEWNDLNDILADQKNGGIDSVKRCIRQLDPWCIPGNPGDAHEGRRRVFLPEHDFQVYWKFRVKPDFTQVISLSTDDDSDEKAKVNFNDLAGFRIAAINRVEVASSTATMSGVEDSSPSELLAVTVQSPRSPSRLIRQVIKDEKLHSKEWWSKIGPIYKPVEFLRLLNILERTAHLNKIKASNFVGLCYHNSRLIVNEGNQTFFQQPHKQCVYHNLTFPSGSIAQARHVIDSYADTFKQNAALFTLVWALGAHLKVLLGFWPHLAMEANKGAGKSTLLKRLEQTIAFKMLSGQSTQTDYRILTSLSGTSHPVGWEELSARGQKVIDAAASMLQECYQHSVTNRGPENLEFLVAAPVLLAGEDVKSRIETIFGKIVTVDLTDRKGEPLPADLPVFPVFQWLKFLTEKNKSLVAEAFEKAENYCLQHSSAPADDAARRIIRNFAAVLTAWGLLCEFTGMNKSRFGFAEDLLESMNRFIDESECSREPWVWIMDLIEAEISQGNFKLPYAFDKLMTKDSNGLPMHEECLLIRPKDIMAHISTAQHLRQKYDALPIKGGKVLLNQLARHEIIEAEDIEKRINCLRVQHLKALSLKKMARYGIYFSPPNGHE